MAKPSYEVIKCEAGQENLQKAVNDIADRGEIVSVVPDYREGLFGGTSGEPLGYLIVARTTE